MEAERIATYEISEDGSESDRQYDFSKRGIYTFWIDGLEIDTYIVVREGSNSILWCGQSAVTAEARHNLPMFHRITWADSFSSSFVTFNDPTLYLYEDLLGGWSQGSLKTHAIMAMHKVISIIRNSINRSAKSVYYGSSAGGFWAMMNAALDDSVCMVEIPQTDMLTYPWVRHRELLLDRCYRDHSVDPKDFIDRLRVASWFKKIKATPKEIHYYQNAGDHDHIETQLVPFQAEMRDIGYENLYVNMYERADAASGHTVMNKVESVVALRKLLAE